MVLKSSVRSVILIISILSAVVFVSVGDTRAGAFEKGSSRASIVVGSGWTLDNSYVILGLGAGYYVFDGLEIGLDGEAWLGGDPDIYKLSPQMKYTLPVQSRVRPYVGAFYSHIFIDGYDDLDTTGVRGGVYFTSDEKWFFGVGAVYESYLNCDDTILSSCDNIYPEVSFSFSF
ncbi:MAG: hypothetical protein JRE12_02990 [Deltaproteobacteria bacterium]|nr:hypothetical protein [Deltaproteobacteria bacterium]